MRRASRNLLSPGGSLFDNNNNNSDDFYENEASEDESGPSGGADNNNNNNNTGSSSGGNQDDAGDEQVSPPKPSVNTTRSGRASTKPPVVYQPRAKAAWEPVGDLAMSATGHDDAAITPMNFKNAMAGDDAEKWMEAMKKEIKSLESQNTWVLTDLPPGRKPVGSKWVFKIKRNADGSIDRYKARLVAQGFSQVAGFDYEETFSPVVRIGTLRLVIAICAWHGWTIEQCDVTSAFLHSALDEEVYMKQPPGLADAGDERVCLLKKSLYGLKQAGRNWNLALDDWMLQNGMKRCSSDPCVYISDGSVYSGWFVVCVYVDDNVMGAEVAESCKVFMQRFKKAFNVEDAKELSWCLGIQVTRGGGSVKLGQAKYICDMLERFDMTLAHPQVTPATEVKLSKEDCPVDGSEEQQEMKGKPYRELIGSLNYASTCTRVDITNAVGVLCPFAEWPGFAHWTGAKRVLRYLKGTVDDGLVYKFGSGAPIALVGYSDSDWAGDVDDRKSTSGYVFTIGSGAVSWKSKKQPFVALSSGEAEYVAFAAATQEAMHLRQLLAELGFEQDGPTVIYEDNNACVSMTKNPIDSARTKHIGIKYHYVRDLVEKKQIVAVRMRTEEMPADFLTKYVPRAKMDVCKKVVMGSDC